jgi:type I restriction enzyme S subunit
VGKLDDSLLPANTNQALAILRLGAKSDLDPSFLFHLLRSANIARQIQDVAVQGAQANISLQNVAEFVIPIPALHEQRSIAGALSETDSLIEWLERLITKKRSIKQSAMQRLLTGKTRLHGFVEEWAEKPLSELFDFAGGFTASRDQLSPDIGVCYLHYGDIHGSARTFIDVSSEFARIPKLEIDLKRIGSGPLLRDGDVVFVDASEDDDGTSKHVVVRNKANLPFISGLHTIVAKRKTDELDEAFLAFCFQTSAIQQQFNFFAVGTKVKGVNKTTIKSIKLRFPVIKEQVEIAKILSDMDFEIEQLTARLFKTRDIKQGMMQQLLTGKVRLV